MKILYIVIILFIMNTALAHSSYRNSDCVREFSTQISVEEKLSSQCQEDNKLELLKGYQRYNYLEHSPLEVKYWLGSFTREIITTTKTLSELVNTCRGSIIRSKIIEDVQKNYIYFYIENPNLDPNIKESYRVLPMDDRRAKEALDRIQKDCEGYQL